MSKFFKDLENGLQEIVAHQQGKLKLSSEILELPEPPTTYKTREIRKIREKKLTHKGYLLKY